MKRLLKQKTYYGQCSYHWGTPVNGLKGVQLYCYYNGKREYQHATAVCGKCRAYLKGHFRYADVTAQFERV